MMRASEEWLLRDDDAWEFIDCEIGVELAWYRAKFRELLVGGIVAFPSVSLQTPAPKYSHHGW